jgi:hypothetical protein
MGAAGFRSYDPGLNQFVSRDMYNGALNDMGLTTDSFTGSRRAFGNGNPVSSIELDGHLPCDPEGRCGSIQALDPYNQAAALNATRDAATGAINAIFSPGSGGTGRGTSGSGSAASLLGGILNGIWDTGAQSIAFFESSFINSMPTGATPNGQLTFSNKVSSTPTAACWQPQQHPLQDRPLRLAPAVPASRSRR